jgi:bifunctional isochorismate lyase/aryl carrier protein
MGIPAIANYAIPEDIPSARVSWSPDVSRTALLVHDMQAYFLRAFDADAAPLNTVISNIAQLLDQCRALGIPVFYTAQRGNQLRCDRGLQADFWGPGMSATEEHEQIVAPLQPQSGDIQLHKHRYSAFQRSNLLTLMQARKRDQLLVCGVYAQIGCQLTIAEAFQHDIEAFMISDAVAAYSRAHHEQALAYVAGCCGVVMNTQQVLSELARPAQTE